VLSSPLVRRLARIAAVLLALAIAGPLVFIEGVYRYGLTHVGELPTPPAVREPLPAERVLWIAEHGPSTPKRERAIYPWTVIRWFYDLKGSARENRLASSAARMWLRRGEPPSLKHWHLKNFALIVWLSRHFTNDELLLFESDHLYFGRGAVGLDAASQAYFAKPARALAPEEMALLAGLPRSPHRLNPSCRPEAALKRRRYVLEQMVQAGELRELGSLAESPMAVVLRPCPPPKPEPD
jgi:hypothetical protein